MVIKRKPINEMDRDATDYLLNNTAISFLNEGGNAIGIVKASNREVHRLQDLATNLFNNSRPSSANGVFLDLIGDMLNVERMAATAALVDKSEGILRFYVESGTLGAYLPHPTDPSKGRIPSGVRMTNTDGNIVFTTVEDTVFPRGVRSVYVSAISSQQGSSQSVGTGVINTHTLGVASVLVRNESPIRTGRDSEDDESYRFRIANAVFSLAGGNKSAIEAAVVSFPGIQSVEVQEFARGAGSFDLFVVPVHQKLGEALRRRVDQSIQRTKALGISARVKEPKYAGIAISVELLFVPGVDDGTRQLIRDTARSAIKDYLETIPLAGELVINQLRAAVMSSSTSYLRDMKILELCFKGRPQIIRNIRLQGDEIFILDEERSDPIEVL